MVKFPQKFSFSANVSAHGHEEIADVVVEPVRVAVQPGEVQDGVVVLLALEYNVLDEHEQRVGRGSGGGAVFFVGLGVVVFVYSPSRPLRG